MHSGQGNVKRVTRGIRGDRPLVHQHLCQSERGVCDFNQWQRLEAFQTTLRSRIVAA